MNYKTFIIKYAEIGTKGKNRYVFEDILCHRMRQRLKPLGEFTVKRDYGRIYVTTKQDEYDYDEMMRRLTKIFGITGVCPVSEVKEITSGRYVGSTSPSVSARSPSKKLPTRWAGAL